MHKRKTADEERQRRQWRERQQRLRAKRRLLAAGYEHFGLWLPKGMIIRAWLVHRHLNPQAQQPTVSELITDLEKAAIARAQSIIRLWEELSRT